MTPLQKAAQALIDRWDSPDWKDQPHTAEYIAELRKALDAEIAQAVEPVSLAKTKTEQVAGAISRHISTPLLQREVIAAAQYIVHRYMHPPQPHYGWLQAVDKEMVCAHLGVANITDTFDEANAKLLALINWHVAVATDPAVNGGLSLQPQATTVVPDDAITKEIEIAIVDHCMGGDLWVSACLGTDRIKRLLSAAQGEKP